MFRKLSIAALLVLATGAEAQKRVTTVPFCATPTLEASPCAIDPAGLLTCDGDPVSDGTAVFVRPASLNNPTGNHLSTLRSGTCAAAGAGRIGVWEATCVRDVYEPIVVRLTDAITPALGGPAPTQDQLIAACQAQAVTPAQAGTTNALCSAQLSVTENAAAKAVSKLGSSTWYNYEPTAAYNLIGGYIDQTFGAPLLAGIDTQRYCIFWPAYNAVVGESGGGTNKWAKPVIDTVTTSSAATNAPAARTGFFDLLATQPGADARNAALFNPRYQETITVNYFKSYLPAGSL